MLKSRVAIVTGATSGIGLAIAKALAGEGCSLMIGGLAPAGVPERVCQEISRDNGVEVVYSDADLSKAQDARRMAADAIQAFGKVDILVNNAGLQFVAPLVEFPEEKWDYLRAVILDAPFHLTKATLPGMIERKWGRIINISSVHGVIASPHKAAYIAFKHGLVGLTRAVALEVAELGITCNAICPSLVVTDVILKQLPQQAKVLNCTEDEVMRGFVAGLPTKRAIDPSELGATAAFLCSEGAKSITGTTIVVDGGQTAH